MNPQDLIDRVRSSIPERDRVMEELFRNDRLKTNTRKFVMGNGGAADDAETILCDAIINFIKNCYKDGFEIRSTIENYFFGVTKNLWFRTIRERKSTSSLEEIPEPPERTENTSPEILLIDLERRQNLEVILQKIDEKCRQVLTMWAQDMKMQAIARNLNYSSPEVVRKKKHFCLKKLIELVNAHPGFIDSLKKQP
jgi:RNA polymerase sigma factor (sigma-70 family)